MHYCSGVSLYCFHVTWSPCSLSQESEEIFKVVLKCTEVQTWDAVILVFIENFFFSCVSNVSENLFLFQLIDLSSSEGWWKYSSCWKSTCIGGKKREVKWNIVCNKFIWQPVIPCFSQRPSSIMKSFNVNSFYLYWTEMRNFKLNLLFFKPKFESEMNHA